MKLTNEQIEKILEDAPDGATDYDERVKDYIKTEWYTLDGIGPLMRSFYWYPYLNGWQISRDNEQPLRHLPDLREIQELRREVERLNDELELYREVAKRFNEEQAE